MIRRTTLSMHALQRADQLLGWIACAALQPVRWLRPLGRLLPRREPSGRVLLVKFWGLGSLQLMTPAVRALRERHAGSELVLLTLAHNREFAQQLAAFDRVLTFDVDSPRWSGVFMRILRLVALLRRERFDTVYDFEFFTRFSALVTLATGSRDTHGFATSKVWRGAFHHREVLFNRYWHVARNFRLLAGGEDGAVVEAADVQPPRFSVADEDRVERKLAAAGLPVGTPYAVLDPNAGALSLERRWPVQNFAELGARLARDDGLGVVLIGSASERDHTARVRDLARDLWHAELVDLSGQLTIAGLAALLARASVVVSNDSGPMHVAAALGAPTVGLFGPETPVMYAPLGTQALALYRPTPCSPCINVHRNKFASCAFGHPHCLVNLGVAEVLGAARAAARGAAFTLDPRPAPGRTQPTPTHRLRRR